MLEMVKGPELEEQELVQGVEVRSVLLFQFYILIFQHIAENSRYSH